MLASDGVGILLLQEAAATLADKTNRSHLLQRNTLASLLHDSCGAEMCLFPPETLQPRGIADCIGTLSEKQLYTWPNPPAERYIPHTARPCPTTKVSSCLCRLCSSCSCLARRKYNCKGADICQHNPAPWSRFSTAGNLKSKSHEQK